MESLSIKEIIWIPKKRVGPFYFNMDINEYHKYPLKMVEDEDPELGWDGYRLEEKDILIYTEKGKIISIACYQECIYKGTNLINLSFNKAKILLKSSPTEQDIIELEEGPQQVYEFDNYCLQAWVKNNKIVCAGLYSEDEG